MVDSNGSKVWDKIVSDGITFNTNPLKDAIECFDGGIALTGYCYSQSQTSPLNSISVIKIESPSCLTIGQVFVTSIRLYFL
ncbi:MAG: hypothetical protein IPN54_02395 [Bacteroidetes bacterium]|nr:hypothetical protein [Bacteroidota bacterium]